MQIPTGSHIIFQAYGHEGILQECTFALLSLCRQHTKAALDPLIVWIYTDNPAFFTAFHDCPLDIRFREINPAQIQQWRGSINFLHRVKIEMLLDITREAAGQILYLDTDIMFTAPVAPLLEHIKAGRRYMHIMEGRVHDSRNVMLRKLSAFLHQHNPLTVDGAAVVIPEDVMMWNAGVLGFSSTDRHLLETALRFTDSVYRQFPKHVVEQFAFSFYFQQGAPLLTAHTTISHYWNLKEIRAILASFFRHFQACTWEEMVRYSVLIQLPDPMQQKVNFLQNRSVLGKFRKEQWQPEIPQWDLLVQQL